MSDAARHTLYIMRHAHSSWALPGQRDHQRDLDRRGQADARRVGAEIARMRYDIRHVVCSTAVRAVRTVAAMEDLLPAGLTREFSDDLYALGVEAYDAAARRCGSMASGLVVGHNPAIGDWAASLAGSGDPEALDILRSGFPTAGLAIIDFQVPLGDIGAGMGRLRRMIHPRTLAKAG